MPARFELPDVDFVDVDAEEFENIGVSKFEKLAGVTLSDADPRRKMIQAAAYLATILANGIDYTGKQNLLAYAVDNHLDHKGEAKGIPRLEPQRAATTIRFEVDTPEEYILPAGIRFNINDLYFITEKEAFITPETEYIDVPAYCDEPGTIGNGYLPGQITEIVDSDMAKWVSTAYNISKTEGGTDWEDDEAYAQRIHDGNGTYTTAGSEEAYAYFAKLSHPNIIDVKVNSPEESVVDIIPLMTGGSLSNEDEKAEILTFLSDKKIKALTDQIRISDPTVHSYDMDITYYLPANLESTEESAKRNVETAINDYLSWQKSKLGRGIDPSELYQAIQSKGAKRITIVPNEYVPLENDEVAQENEISINFGGFIND